LIPIESSKGYNLDRVRINPFSALWAYIIFSHLIPPLKIKKALSNPIFYDIQAQAHKALLKAVYRVLLKALPTI